MSEYPKSFLRGLQGNVLTERGYVLADAFSFGENKERTTDDRLEMSINWEDSDEAVDVLLQQKKKDTDVIQFNVGFARLNTKDVMRSLDRFIRDGLFGYERKTEDWNPYHGNLLEAREIFKKGEEKLIKNTLANIASLHVYKRDSEASPYLDNSCDVLDFENDNKEGAQVKEEGVGKMRNPKVSVIIPVYGVEKYIERCARSLFEQTLDDIEYLFIDDCTPDRSVEILRTVLEEYPQRKEQVVIHRMERNSGQAKVREWGMRNATGQFFIHCDSDDWIDKDMYRMMYATAMSDDADMVVCNYCESTDDDVKSVVKGCHTRDVRAFFENIIYQRDQWSMCNKLFRRALLKENFIYPKYAMGEDYVMCLQLVWNSSKMSYIDKTFYFYYINEQSLTKSVSVDTIEKRFHQSIGNADVILYFLEREGLYEQCSEAIDCVLLNKKNILLPLLGNKKYYQMWYDTFPQLNYKIFLNRQLPFRTKMKHLFALLPFRKLYFRYEE